MDNHQANLQVHMSILRKIKIKIISKWLMDKDSIHTSLSQLTREQEMEKFHQG
jgi:hypothetical protein